VIDVGPGCYRSLGRMTVGNLILDELPIDGFEITERAKKIINDVLDGYEWDAVVRGYKLVTKIPNLSEMLKIYKKVISKINAQKVS
jgi:hypothetical protein